MSALAEFVPLKITTLTKLSLLHRSMVAPRVMPFATVVSFRSKAN
jgi:hypothetical protein